MSTAVTEYIDTLPNICGSEDLIARTMSSPGPHYPERLPARFRRDPAAPSAPRFTMLHQPLIPPPPPAGGPDIRTAAVISNLKDMMDHPGIGDNHNASVFAWCYKRMGEFIPQVRSFTKARIRASCWTIPAPSSTDFAPWASKT